MRVNGLLCEVFTAYSDIYHFYDCDNTFNDIYKPKTRNPKMIVYVLKWTDSGRAGHPDFAFLGLTMVEHLYNDDYEKADYFVYIF